MTSDLPPHDQPGDRMTTLKTSLNSLFSAPLKARSKPGTYFVNGVKITKNGKLWTATIPGHDKLLSWHLGDLKLTIERLTREAR